MFHQVIDLYHQEFCESSLTCEDMKKRLEGTPLLSIPTKKYREDFRALLSEAMGVSLWQRAQKQYPSLSIRMQEKDDKPLLNFFLREFHKEIHGHGTPRKIDYDVCLVAEEKDTQSGAAWYYYNDTLAGRTVFLERLYILPEYRRKSHGQALLEHLVEREKSLCEGIQLIAPESAIPFYSKLGFRRIGKEHSDGRQNFSLLYVMI